jgi:hypothetical protein
MRIAIVARARPQFVKAALWGIAGPDSLGTSVLELIGIKAASKCVE